MNIPSWLDYLIPVISLGVLSLLFTEAVRRISLKVGFVYRPVSDRWNRREVPMGGGLGIHLAVLIGLFVFERELFSTLAAPIGALIVFGLADDVFGFMPWTKLGFQAIIAWFAVKNGYLISTPWPLFSQAASVMWILFVTNAINLNDNMDGLVSGFLVTSALGLALVFGVEDFGTRHLTLSLIVSGAALGFLVHNFHPARIFMGDAGSLPFGFILAILTLKLGSHGGTDLIQMPLILLMPVFDALFVMALRARDGKPVMKGGVDHTSHRLVRAGVNESGAVALLHLLNLFGVIAAVTLSTATDGVTNGLALVAIAVVFIYFAYVLIQSEKGATLSGFSLVRHCGATYDKAVFFSRKWLGFSPSRS